MNDLKHKILMQVKNDLEEIGSYPEDWPYDGSIQEKVESLARRFQ